MLAIIGLVWSSHAVALDSRSVEASPLGTLSPFYTGGGLTANPTKPAFFTSRGVAQKAEQVALYQANIEGNLAGASSSSSDVSCPGGCLPQSGQLPNFPDERQAKSYYCGPGAGRNALLYIMGGGAPDQYTLADKNDMQTDQRGETDGNTTIASVLDKWQSRNPYNWEAPSDYGQLVTWLADDIWNWNSPVVQNLDTVDLYWFGTGANSHTYWHNDVLYGYDESQGGHVYVAEEYDSQEWGVNSINSYGYWNVKADTDYAAVHASPSQGVTW